MFIGGGIDHFEKLLIGSFYSRKEKSGNLRGVNKYTQVPV